MKRGFNIGTFLFAAVFVYLVIALILYLTRSHIAPYEVSEGTIVEDSVYTGVIVRRETGVKSPRAGYLHYYLDDKSKSGRDQHVCAVSGEDLTGILKDKAGKKKKLSDTQQSMIVGDIQNYVSTAGRHDYGKLYELHDQIESGAGIAASEQAAGQLDQLAEGGADLAYVDAPEDGVIVYATDSLHGLKGKEISDEVFDQKKYSERSVRQGSKVKKGETLFTVVTDENWQVYIPLSRQMKKKLKDIKMIETRLGNRPGSIWGGLAIVEENGETYGRLTYSTDMLRFASQRFINVELILQNDKGLKLPRSAVSEQTAYEIPESFIVTDPDTQKTGVELVNGKGKRKFTPFDVFYRSDGHFYAKKDAFEKGDVIGKDNEDETYTIGKKRKFKGVYNINKGYAVFQAIDIIASNDRYYVIDEHSAYGPVLYDHIALNADKLSENEVVQTAR